MSLACVTTVLFRISFPPSQQYPGCKNVPPKKREREAGVGMSFPAEEPDLPQFYWFFPPIEALLSLLRQPILMAFYCLLLDFFFFFFSGRWNKALRLVVLGGGIVLKVTPHHAPSFSSGWPLSPGSCYYVTNRKWLASPSGLRQKKEREATQRLEWKCWLKNSSWNTRAQRKTVVRWYEPVDVMEPFTVNWFWEDSHLSLAHPSYTSRWWNMYRKGTHFVVKHGRLVWTKLSH